MGDTENGGVYRKDEHGGMQGVVQEEDSSGGARLREDNFEE